MLSFCLLSRIDQCISSQSWLVKEIYDTILSSSLSRNARFVLSRISQKGTTWYKIFPKKSEIVWGLWAVSSQILKDVWQRIKNNKLNVLH